MLLQTVLFSHVRFPRVLHNKAIWSAFYPLYTLLSEIFTERIFFTFRGNLVSRIDQIEKFRIGKFFRTVNLKFDPIYHCRQIRLARIFMSIIQPKAVNEEYAIATFKMWRREPERVYFKAHASGVGNVINSN